MSRRTVLWVAVALLAFSFVGNQVLSFIAYDGGGHYNAFAGSGDSTSTWCASCTPLLDALGETTENTLACAFIGAAAGVPIGVFLRLTRR